MKPSPGVLWGTATLMVTLVSCCSLVGVSILPLISGRFYKSFITLFTGLAVGSLLGSAIFSLLPQAFGLQTQADKAYLWKSLVVFLGIYMFYCSERLMRIYFDKKTRQMKNRATTPEQLKLKDNTSGGSGNSKTDNSNDRLTRQQSKQSNSNNNSNSNSSNNSNNNKSIDNNMTDTQTSPSTSASHEDNKELDLIKAAGDEFTPIDDHQHGHHHHHHHHDLLKPHEIITKALKGETISSNVARGAPISKMPKGVVEIAPVAWMIIIGDGLHNFIDGLSIGAAFNESVYQGMIICIAVIFEELPHELGDFAVLISSGMTVRQAIGFNFLSACTCYIGMIFGIIFGDTTQSASFIFALASGMFFYISLVDMMGELSAALEECKHSTKQSIHLLLMQNIGILSGITIIFTLSLFGPGG